MWMGGKHLGNAGGLMPGSIVYRNEHGLAQRGGIGPRDVPQVGREGVLQPYRLRASPAALGRRALYLARRQPPRHDLERRRTIDQIFVVPCPDDGPVAFDAQRRP